MFSRILYSKFSLKELKITILRLKIRHQIKQTYSVTKKQERHCKFILNTILIVQTNTKI